jgi:hypothetical protein
MRLTVSHGPAQSHMFGSRYSSDSGLDRLVPSSETSTYGKRLTFYIVHFCLLKLPVDVLPQYSSPNLALRMITGLITALLPKYNNIDGSLCPMPPTRLRLIRRANIDRNHFRNSKLCIFAAGSSGSEPSPRGCDLVTGVTSNSTTSHFHCRIAFNFNFVFILACFFTFVLSDTSES